MRHRRRRDLTVARLSYGPPGATCPQDSVWESSPSGYRRYEGSARIGSGPQVFAAAAQAVLSWGVKTRSGFRVEPIGRRVQLGERLWITAHPGPLVIREPAVVVAVVDEADRCGFAYGTLQGHPVSGEEAFVVHLSGDGEVWLTLRSLTRAPRGPWRLVYPVSLVAQRIYRRRYLKALL